MSNIIQNYQFNEDFRLCSVQQLNAASNNEYKWQGRKVVSWFDNDGNTYEVAGIANFGSKPKASISARWELSDFNVNVDFKTGHGKVIVTTSCDEMPLPSGIASSVELEKDAQTSSNILYNSLLSIDAVPENEEYETTRFDVNNDPQILSDQYIYKNASTGDKTGSNAFNVIVGFNINHDVAGISVSTIDGNTIRVPYSTLPNESSLKMFAADGQAQQPFDGYEGMNRLSIIQVVDPYSLISSIEDNSFYRCINLSSIECSNVLSIGKYAFYNAIGVNDKLSCIDMPNTTYIGDYAFANNHKLTSISFPFVEFIGPYAFTNCEKLSSICISNVISVETGAFGPHTNKDHPVKIQTIDIPKAIYLKSRAFNNCKELYAISIDNVLSIFGNTADTTNYSGAFGDCIKLSSVYCPSVEYIGYGTFYNCSGLLSINLPNVITLNGYAFNNCTSLISVDIPKLEKLNNGYNFQNCLNLISINISKVDDLPIHTFDNCFSLSSINCDAVLNIDSNCFENCQSLLSVNLPNATRIYNNAFKNCFVLADVYSPKLTSFSNIQYPDTEFYGCDSLSSLSVSNSKWKSIGNGLGIRDQIVVDAAQSSIIVYAVHGIDNLSNDSILSIGQNAFKDHNHLSSIDLKNALSIGQYAFQNAFLCSICCPEMKFIDQCAFKNAYGPETIDLPNLLDAHEDAFQNNKGIKHAVFPKLSSIGRELFNGCENLESIECLSATAIGLGAFTNCYHLTSISIPNFYGILEGNMYLTSNLGTFQNCSSLISGDFSNVSAIQGVAFYGCSSLISVDFPNCKYVGTNDASYGGPFQNCSSLKYAKFENAENSNTTYYSSYKMFRDCHSLTAVEFPKYACINRAQMFYNCSSLPSVAFPSLTAIDGDSTFYGCSSLISIDCPKLSSIADSTFSNCQSLKTIDNLPLTSLDVWHAFGNCYDLSSIDLPHISGSIGKNSSSNTNGIFYRCGGLVKASFINANSIACGAFAYNSNLQHVDIQNVLSIYAYAFQNCNSLVSIELPNLLSLDSKAFTNCTSISSMILSANNNIVTIAGGDISDLFKNIGHVVSVYIPDGMSADYMENSNWKWLKNNMRVDFIECP